MPRHHHGRTRHTRNGRAHVRRVSPSLSHTTTTCNDDDGGGGGGAWCIVRASCANQCVHQRESIIHTFSTPEPGVSGEVEGGFPTTGVVIEARARSPCRSPLRIDSSRTRATPAKPRSSSSRGAERAARFGGGDFACRFESTMRCVCVQCACVCVPDRVTRMALAQTWRKASRSAI